MASRRQIQRTNCALLDYDRQFVTISYSVCESRILSIPERVYAHHTQRNARGRIVTVITVTSMS